MYYDYKKIPTFIRSVRQAKELTQFYMATKMGISQNGYSKLELGTTQLNIDRLVLIAKLLDLDVATILENAAVEVEKPELVKNGTSLE